MERPLRTRALKLNDTDGPQDGFPLKGWCTLTEPEVVSPGEFLRVFFQSHSSAPLHSETAFLKHLAELVMQRYEGYPVHTIRALPIAAVTLPRRSRNFFKRLFNADGSPTQDFVAWASEVLALWIESELAGSVYSEGSSSHMNDPAYDILSIYRDDAGEATLRVLQVKSTQSNVQSNASSALAKFEKLENGDYDSELASRLELIQRRVDAPTSIRYGDLLYAPERQYRVVVVHEESTDSFSVLTQFHTKVVGRVERRGLLLVKVEWTSFWSTLAEIVYDQLSL